MTPVVITVRSAWSKRPFKVFKSARAGAASPGSLSKVCTRTVYVLWPRHAFPHNAWKRWPPYTPWAMSGVHHWPQCVPQSQMRMDVYFSASSSVSLFKPRMQRRVYLSFATLVLQNFMRVVVIWYFSRSVVSSGRCFGSVVMRPFISWNPRVSRTLCDDCLESVEYFA